MGKSIFRWIVCSCIILALTLFALHYNTQAAVNNYGFKDSLGAKEMNYAAETVVISSNDAIAQQLDIKKGGKPNTVYIISSDINLLGKTIELPEACVLKFDGGCLSNGIIVGNNTVIDALPKQIFTSTLVISGTWCIETAYVEWYGCKAQQNYNKNVAIKNAEAIQNSINAFKNVSFAVSSNNTSFYYVSAKRGSKCVISINEPVTVSGKNQVSTQIVYVGDEDIPVFYFTKEKAEYVFGSRYSSIKNLCIRGIDNKSKLGSGIYVDYGVAKVWFENLLFCYLNNGFVCDSWSVTLNNCKAEVSNTGFRLGVNNKGLPALNLTRCATDYCKTAFVLKSVYYSSFISCSSDHCDLVWDIYNCNGLSFMTAGAEHCKRYMNIDGSGTRNIKVSNAFVCVYKNDEITNDDWNSFICVGEKAFQIVMDGIDFEMNEPKVLSKVKNRNKSFIKVKGDKSSFTIINSYCGLGDLNSYIDYSR